MRFSLKKERGLKINKFILFIFTLSPFIVNLKTLMLIFDFTLKNKL
jgi:hypothetical protein